MEQIMSRGTRFPWMDGRYVCTVLEEMRRCDSTKNYAPLSSLIEEAQTMVNNMETALGWKSDIEQVKDAYEIARKLVKQYKKEMDKKKPDMKKVDGILEKMKGLA